MRPRLTLSAPCLRDVAFADRLAAASDAGFDSIGLGLVEFEAAVSEGWDVEGMRGAISDAGLTLDELIWVDGWWRREMTGREGDKIEQKLFELADAFSAQYVVATGDLAPSMDETARRFGALCDRADEHGLRVALEFLPWRSISNASTALEVVEAADRANGGLIVDSWHVFRGTSDLESLRSLPAERVVAIQLNDGGDPLDDPLEDTRHFRLAPGEGSFDLVGFFEALDVAGVNAPIAVEVLSDEVALLDASAACHRLMRSTTDVLARARAHA